MQLEKSFAAILCFLSISATAFYGQQPATPSVQLRLTAPTHEPIVLSQADLKSHPHITISIQNPHSNEKETYSGVRLSELLTKMAAPLGKELRGKAMLTYLKASAADGYAVVYSLAEVDPEFHPGEVIVADEMNGQPLDAHSGPFKLVATEDKRPARWVRNLTTLELKTAD